MLARQTNLPLIHLDREFWRPGWAATPRGAWRAKVIELVAGENWIMEGDYGSSLDLRLPHADTLIWFDYPRRRCLWRVIRRILMTYGQVRPDMAPGCPERIDITFLRWIWNFNRCERPALLQRLVASGGHLTPIIFRNDGDASQFLSKL
jgi:adenylate kinase family enzyme